MPHKMGFPHGPTVTQNADGTLCYRGSARDQWLEDGDGRDKSGTSIFDPVLCELVYRWFCPSGGTVLDPFAGGSVRGIVASYLGYSYTGVDLSREQVKANEAQAKAIISHNEPRWIVGDSIQISRLAKGKYDLVFTCPPYFDLELYSDDARDLSNMSWSEFLSAYRAIISQSCAMLRDNRFACFVIGDVRDRRGFYRNLPGETITAFCDAGLMLYNEAVLITAVGSLPIRVGKQFGNYRKLGKTHQNVLVFYKGNPKAIPDKFNEIDVFDFADMYDGYDSIEPQLIESGNGKAKAKRKARGNASDQA